MLPPAKALMNDSHKGCQHLLIHTLTSPSLEHDSSSTFHTSRVVAEKGEDGGPLGHHRLPFVALPALVDLTDCAKLFCHILLMYAQAQPPVAQMLSKCYWLVKHVFLSQNE